MGAGLLLIEATAVEAPGRISSADMGLWTDQHIPPLAGKPQALATRDFLGVAERIGGAAPVVVVRVFEDGADGGHGFSGRIPAGFHSRPDMLAAALQYIGKPPAGLRGVDAQA